VSHHFVVLLLLILSISVTSADTGETKQQLQSIKTEIQALSRDVSQNKASKSELYSQLKQQSRAVSTLNKELLTIKQKMSSQKRDLRKLQQHVEQQQGAHLEQLEALNQQIRSSYFQGKPSLLKVLLNQHDPATISRSSSYFRYFNQARQQQLNEINLTLNNLSHEQKELYIAQKKQTQLYAEQKNKQQQLTAQTVLRQTTLTQLEAKITDQDSRLNSLREEEDSLQALLQSLNQPKASVTQKPIIHKSPFGQRAGLLTWPIKGKILARYGSSRNIGKLTWQGILISSPAGKDIVAAAPGQVIFADWLRGFGLLIIIDHGDQYMTLYGNNETLLKRAGDSVSAGELIAQSGNKGVRQHAGLYFEIRYKGSPTNPLKWLSKRS